MAPVLVAFTAFVLSFLVGWLSRPVAATRVLATRHPARPVWLGVTVALVLQAVVAVVVGAQFARLPYRPVALAVVALFAATAVLLPRGARHADTTETERERAYADRIVVGRRGWRAALASFAFLGTVPEWGFLSQALTAGLVASGNPATPVLVGAVPALATVSGLVVLRADWLLHRVRLGLVRYLASVVCVLLATVTALSILD